MGSPKGIPQSSPRRIPRRNLSRGSPWGVAQGNPPGSPGTPPFPTSAASPFFTSGWGAKPRRRHEGAAKAPRGRHGCATKTHTNTTKKPHEWCHDVLGYTMPNIKALSSYLGGQSEADLCVCRPTTLLNVLSNDRRCRCIEYVGHRTMRDVHCRHALYTRGPTGRHESGTKRTDGTTRTPRGGTAALRRRRDGTAPDYVAKALTNTEIKHPHCRLGRNPGPPIRDLSGMYPGSIRETC